MTVIRKSTQSHLPAECRGERPGRLLGEEAESGIPVADDSTRSACSPASRERLPEVSAGQTSNPFATRYVRPGSIPFLCPEDWSLESLVRRLRETDWWGQVVGPHGVGKSTLLHALAPHLQRAGKNLLWCTLLAGQSRLPSELVACRKKPWPAQTLLIIDGYEQLGRWSRFRLKRRCRAAGAGLLVTAHHDAGMPELVTLNRCSVDVVHQLVTLLEGRLSVISREDVSRAYAMCHGNVRDVFFALYDLYETRRASR